MGPLITLITKQDSCSFQEAIDESTQSGLLEDMQFIILVSDPAPGPCRADQAVAKGNESIGAKWR